MTSNKLDGLTTFFKDFIKSISDPHWQTCDFCDFQGDDREHNFHYEMVCIDTFTYCDKCWREHGEPT